MESAAGESIPDFDHLSGTSVVMLSGIVTVPCIPANHGTEIIRKFIPVGFRIMECFQSLTKEVIQTFGHLPLRNMRQIPPGCLVIFKKNH